MARVARETVKGNYFHILVSGLSEINIFAEHKLKTYYIDCITKKAENVTLLSYCVLENHAHIVVYSAEGIQPVAEMMKKADTAFALQYNKYKNRKGYVFNGRFKCQVLETPEEAAACMAFIHSNPIFENPRFNKPDKYPYSGYKRMYLQDKELEEFANTLGFELEDLGAYVDAQTDAYRLYHWIDIQEFIVRERYDDVLDDLAERYSVGNYAEAASDKEMMGAFAYELNKRTGASLLFIAKEMGVGRETLRRAVKKYESTLADKDDPSDKGDHV